MISKPELIKWLNNCMFKGKNGEGVRMFALRHVDADDRTDAVEEWPNKPGTDTADLAEDIILTATRDAIGLEALQKYIVEAYFGTSKTRGRRFTCTIDGGAVEREDGGHGGFSEPAGPKGESMQQRRHLENMHRLSVGGANETIRILRAENSELRDQVTKLMDKHFKVMDTYAELADKQHIRNMEIRKVEYEENLKKQVLDQVVPMLPVIAMKALPAILGESPEQPSNSTPSNSPEAQLFRMIAKHVIDNQDSVMPALFQAFGSNPGILAGIKELVDKYGVDDSAPKG